MASVTAAGSACHFAFSPFQVLFGLRVSVRGGDAYEQTIDHSYKCACDPLVGLEPTHAALDEVLVIAGQMGVRVVEDEIEGGCHEGILQAAVELMSGYHPEGLAGAMLVHPKP